MWSTISTILSQNQGYIIQISGYVVLLLVLYTVVRFIASSINSLRLPAEDQVKTVDPFINDVYYAVSYWSEKGGRPYQEDRHSIIKGVGEEDSSLYAVFDGRNTHK